MSGHHDRRRPRRPDGRSREGGAPPPQRNPAAPALAPIVVAGALAVGAPVALDRAAAAGLRAREINPSEAFTIGDASGAWFRASLTAYRDDGADALVYEAMRGSPEAGIELTLVSAVLARQRMLFVVQKATELGVARVAPVFTAKSVQREGLEHEKAHAWPGQAKKGARQSRRASVPAVEPVVPLSRVVECAWWKGAAVRFVLDDRDDRDAGGDPFDLRLAGSRPGVVLVVGPEGGLADDERAMLVAAGATPVRLGARVLRAETAVFAGLAIVGHRLGDLR